MRIFAEHAWIDGVWLSRAAVSVMSDAVATVQANAMPGPDDIRVEMLVPGGINLHSHAFQRGFAGLAERRGPSSDNF